MVATGFAAFPLITIDGEQGYWIATDHDEVYAFGMAAHHDPGG